MGSTNHCGAHGSRHVSSHALRRLSSRHSPSHIHEPLDTTLFKKILRCTRRIQNTSVQSRAILLDDTGSVLDALPVVGLGSLALALGLLKVMSYSQLEVVRTAMLSRHVRQGSGAVVLQLGGTTRDVYYYPTGTVKITVNEVGINKGLFQQAGMTVGIPVEATSLDIVECLSRTPTASLDSVVSFEQFGNITDASQFAGILSEIARVLKPGGTFIFYQRLANGGLAQLGTRSPGSSLNVGDMIASSVDSLWDFCEYDVAAQGFDAHDVGVAIRRMNNEESTDDEGTFEEILKRQKRQQSSKNKKKPTSFNKTST